MPTFRSAHAELRVGFPPERFGLGEGWEEFYDEHGNPRKRKVPYSAVKFDFGQAVVDDKTAERLRQHDGFRDGMFWEQPDIDTRALAGLRLAPTAVLPDGGLTDNDHGKLDEFTRMAGKVIAASSLNKAHEMLHWAMERFRVTGFTMPAEDRKPSVVRASMVLLLDLLREQGIVTDGEPEQAAAGNGEGAG